MDKALDFFSEKYKGKESPLNIINKTNFTISWFYLFNADNMNTIKAFYIKDIPLAILLSSP